VLLASSWLFAHRGASLDAPENTLAAFRLALLQGADGIELDVHLSADGIPVVIHDSTLDRTTDRSGAVRDLTAADIVVAVADRGHARPRTQLARWLPDEVRVPTLAEVVAWRPAGFGLVVEIKDPSAPRPVIEVLPDSAAPSTRVISFDLATIDEVRRLAPSLSTGLLLSRGDDLDAGIARAAAAGHASVVPFEADLGSDPARAIARVRAAGLEAGCYVVNDPGRATELREAGICFLMTDVPALVRPAANSLE